MLNLELIKSTLDGIQKYSFYGEGVVLFGGGGKYFINAYLNVKLLRFLGCKLPIEWFYIPGECDDRHERIVANLSDVTFREIKGLPNLTPNLPRDGGGWQSKFFAILQSTFDNVIYLDSDCFCQTDPTFLLSCDEFKKYAAMMWYDGFSWNLYQPWFNKNLEELRRQFPSVRFNTPMTFETGQLVISKNRLGDIIYYATELNRWWHRTFRLSLGDKEALYIACETYQRPFYAVPRFPDVVDNAFVQYAPDCVTHLFSHCFASKWDHTCHCYTTPKILPHYKEMQEWCRELIPRMS